MALFKLAAAGAAAYALYKYVTRTNNDAEFTVDGASQQPSPVRSAGFVSPTAVPGSPGNGYVAPT